jgi:hypothetical protein
MRAGSDLAAGFLGAAVSVLLFSAGLALFDRRRLRETYRLGLTAVKSAGARQRGDAVA